MHVRLAVQDGSFAAGSRLQIRRASGPDGRGAALAMVRDRGYGGVVVNPAGPYLVFTAAELAS